MSASGLLFQSRLTWPLPAVAARPVGFDGPWPPFGNSGPETSAKSTRVDSPPELVTARPTTTSLFKLRLGLAAPIGFVAISVKAAPSFERWKGRVFPVASGLPQTGKGVT